MSMEISEIQKATLHRWKRQLLHVLRTIRQYPTAVTGVLIVLAFILLALFAPYIAPYEPTERNLDRTGLPKSLESPSVEHPFGTTHQGKDVLSQWIWGTRISLLVAFVAGISVVIIGTSVGIIGGYYRGNTDMILMRFVDLLYGIPTEPIVLILALVFGASLWIIILVFPLILWRSMARVVRSQTLSLANRPFIKAARASGASDLRILYLHIAPNLLPIIFIEGTLVMARAILIEAGMSFLGVGVQNSVSWGTMLQFTFQSGAIRTAWWWVLPPGISITLVVMAFFYISRAIEEVTNPELSN